mgnify:CR=1 FL=1
MNTNVHATAANAGFAFVNAAMVGCAEVEPA